jgi:putative MATE family efflux protein
MDHQRRGGVMEKPNAAKMERPLWRRVLLLALPVLAQQFLILLVGLSDRWLAGHFEPGSPRQQAEALGQRLLAIGQMASHSLGGGWASALAAETHWEAARQILPNQVAFQAAQTTAIYLGWLINSYMVFVTVGATALVARLIGAGNRTDAIRATNQALLLGLILGVIGSVLGLASQQPLVELLQLHGEAAYFTIDYLTPMFAFLVFQVIQAAGIACLVGAGDTLTGMLVMAGVAVVNIPLAWGLCQGYGHLPKLGFPGIALGTGLSNLLGCLAVLFVLFRGRAGLRFQPRLLWPDGGLLYRLLRVGVPAGVDNLSVMTGQLLFLSIVNRLGPAASGAHGIALTWEALGYLSGQAFGTAAMALVGQNLGARRPRLAARSGWLAFGLGCGVMCAMGVVFFTFAPSMFALFCPHPEQAPVIAAGVPVLRLVAFSMPAVASCIVFTYALRGAGDTRVPVLFTWIGFFLIRVPLAYALTGPAFDLGLFGAWLAMFADLLVRGVFFLYRFSSGRWQLIRV